MFIIITILYARLFVFLRRPDKIRSPYSDSPTYNDSYTNARLSSSFAMGPLKKRGLRLPFFRSRHRHSNDTKSGQYEVHIQGERDYAAYPLREDANEIPPWEKVDLPVFQIDGQKYGGPSANLSPTRPRKHPRTRPKTGESMSSISPSSLPTPAIDAGPTGGPLGPPGEDSSAHHYPSRYTSDQNDGHLEPILAPTLDMSLNDIRRESAATQASSSGRSGSNGTPTMPSSKPVQMQPSISDRGSDAGDDTVTRARALDDDAPRDVPAADHDQVLSEDEELDLMNVLKTTAPPRSQEDKFAPRAGETVVLVEESMASYLNRKTALLMLWFPLGVSGSGATMGCSDVSQYVLLFSVSLIRIICESRAIVLSLS